MLTLFLIENLNHMILFLLEVEEEDNIV